MIALTATLLFAATAIVVTLSLADSAVRGRNAWRAVRRELATERSYAVAPVKAEVIAFQDVKPMRNSHRQGLPAPASLPFSAAA